MSSAGVGRRLTKSWMFDHWNGQEAPLLGEHSISLFSKGDRRVDRLVDVIEELMKFTLLTRAVAPYLVDRDNGRKKAATA